MSPNSYVPLFLGKMYSYSLIGISLIKVIFQIKKKREKLMKMSQNMASKMDDVKKD